MTDDPMPASFVWTGDDGPDDMQRVPEGPALGNYPKEGMVHFGPDYPEDHPIWQTGPDRRSTMGEKLARFLNDLAEKVRGIH